MLSQSPSSSSAQIDRTIVQKRIEALGTWFHNIDLNGVKTAPDHPLGDYPTTKWARFAGAIADKIRGRSVLDVGCNGGFYSIEMKRRGAARVVAVDVDSNYLAQARFSPEVCETEIEFHSMSVYDVALLLESFDIVIFMWV